MRTLLIAFLASAILTGCRNGDTTSVAPFAGRSPIPPAVLQLADAYVDSVSGTRSQDRDHIKDDFIRDFFIGFTNPGATIISRGPEARRRAFLAGQEYRRTNPARIKETMEGFGYTATEADGIWTVSFEHSGFRPDNKLLTQTWWLSYFGDTQSDLPKDMKIPAQGVHIRVTGYLSPSGQFGHMGSYDHEFFATRISKIGG